MTRTTEPLRDITATVRIEVDGERDERDPYRHKWVTRVRCGLLRGSGPNTSTATEALADELRALAECPEAVEALAMARHRAAAARAAAEAKPVVDALQVFERDDPVEVLQLAGDQPGAWLAGEYDAREGQRHSVWVPSLNGWLVVEDSRVRALNRPSLADVG